MAPEVAEIGRNLELVIVHECDRLDHYSWAVAEIAVN